MEGLFDNRTIRRWLNTADGQRIESAMTTQCLANLESSCGLEEESATVRVAENNRVRNDALGEAVETGQPVVYEVRHMGCANVATRWYIAMPSGKLATAVSFYVGPSSIHGERGISGMEATKAVARHERAINP